MRLDNQPIVQDGGQEMCFRFLNHQLVYAIVRLANFKLVGDAQKQPKLPCNDCCASIYYARQLMIITFELLHPIKLAVPFIHTYVQWSHTCMRNVDCTMIIRPAHVL
jgi:hypothetical protein